MTREHGRDEAGRLSLAAEGCLLVAGMSLAIFAFATGWLSGAGERLAAATEEEALRDALAGRRAPEAELAGVMPLPLMSAIQAPRSLLGLPLAKQAPRTRRDGLGSTRQAPRSAGVSLSTKQAPRRLREDVLAAIEASLAVDASLREGAGR